MRIAFNPSTVEALTTPPNNKDITFDLRGHNIFARGVKFCGTDTWRDIKINNVSIGSNILDLRNGSNTTLTNTNGVVTINSTWRPVVDNLTSDSTTSSLSAKQGKVLKSLIDGKSNSGHTHDDRYLKLTGGTMASNALITFADSGSWGTDKGPQGARGGLYWTGQSDYAKLYAEETVGDNLDLVIQFGDDNSNGLSIRNKANTQTSYISAGGVITTGTFKGNLDWSYITNKPSSYTPSAHTHAWNSLTHSSTTENQAILTNGKANGWKLLTLNIARWDNAANNAHSHSNKSVLDGITSALVNNWNTAFTFVNTITGTDTDKVINKWDEIVNFLAGITEDNKLNTLLNSKLSVYELANNTNVGAIKNNGIYYSTSDASSGTLTNSPFNTGFALINMTSYDGGDDLRRSRLAFNAYGEIKVSDDRDLANTAETWYNVLTSKNSGISGSTIKLNGTSITVYSSSTADGRYVKKSGDTMSGVLTIDTTNFGALTIKRNDDANGASIQFRGKSSVYGYIGLNNSTKDKQFLRWNSDTSKTYTILDTSSTYVSSGKGIINGITITQVDNADKVDGYHASSLWRSDGATWNPGANVSLNASANNQEWSFDIRKNGYTGCYWHVWDSTLNSILKVNADNGKVYAPYNFVGNLEGNASTATKLQTSRLLWGQPFNGTANVDGTINISGTSGNYNQGIRIHTFTNSALSSIWFRATNTDGYQAGMWGISVDDNGMRFRGNTSKTATSNPIDYMNILHGGNVGIGTTNPSSKLTINGDISLFNVGSIRNLAIGGGIYWNPYVESTTDGSDAASITVAKSGVAGGTTLVLRLMNDANDTILFLTSTAARLYHNSYPILTTLNTYVSNNKGYINGTEITLVNNANKWITARTFTVGNTSKSVDGSSNVSWSLSEIGAASSNHNHDNKYVRRWEGVYGSANKFLKLTIYDEKGWIRLEVSDSNNALSGGYGIYIIGWSWHGNDRTDNLTVKCLYANDSRYTTALKVVRTSRNNYDFYFLFASGSSYPSYTINYNNVAHIDCTVTAVTTIPTATWTSSLSALQLNASQVDWSGITNKPSAFNPAAHTHTVFKNNLMIKGTNGISDSASIHLGIGDSDTGFKWISDGKCLIYANNTAVGEWTSGGMNWFKNPTVNSNKVWNAGNDGSGSGLDADTVDGYHVAAFNNKPWGYIPAINLNGYMDIGKHLEFHYDNTTGSDYSTILRCTGNYNNIVNLPSASGTLALISDIPSSLKSPYSLTLLANGTTLATYDGSVSKIVNLTYDNVGAAAKNHTHNSLEPWASYITGDSHATALKSIFDKNKTSIPRNKFISMLSSAYDNTSYYMGYFLNGYDNNPYGGFFVAHYNAAYYIGISNGSFSQHRLAYSTDIPNSLKNPHALTISLNGTSLGPYDGSAAKNVNITPGSIGAATSGHNHDNRYLKLTGGTMQLGEGLKFHADENYFGTDLDARIISLLDGNDKVCDGGLIIDERGTLDGTEYVTELLRIRNSEFKWKGSNILHSGNSNINGSTITINGSSLTVSKSDHTHNIYAVNENYGGFKKAGRLPTSGFYQSNESESGGNAPWSSWVHLINCLHSTISNNFALLIAASFFDNNTFKIRVTNNSVNNAWRDIIHSGNIGSQLVKGAYMTPLTLDIATLISSGYLASDYNNRYDIVEYMKAAAKYLLKNYPGYSVFGTMGPNAMGFFTANIYDSGFNSNGNPEHITIHYYPHGGNIINCGTTYGSWYYNTINRDGSSYKLQTARKIWGQSFDGTADISGTLSGVAHILFSADNTYNIGSNSAASKYIYTYWLGAKSGLKLELGANNSNFGLGLCIDTNLNVGIGTNTPAYKLHVNGTFRATNSTVSNLFVNTGDATLKIYTGRTTDALNDGNICFLTSIDATDGQSHAYPTLHLSRCNIVLQPRGGLVYIGTNPSIGNTTYKLYVNSKIFSNGGFVKNGSSDSYVLLGGGGHKTESSLRVAYASSAGNADTLDGLDSTKFLRQVVVPNNTENDFNTFSNMTLTGRADPTTGASLKNAPWSGSGPGGGYGVLTYLFNGWDYGTQMAWEYGSNRIYIRNRYWGGSGVGLAWRTSWDKLALTTDIPSSLKNPYALTLKANGTTLAIYDGSSSKEANFTYANVGAAPASHTHTAIVAEDLRSKYPGQILDPQRMKLSFLAASTLGIKNDGSYFDVITVRSYRNSTGGSDNALLFSKNSNSLYHTRFAFGSTSSWGSPLLIIDSGNIGSQSVAYASKAGSVAWDSITGKPTSFTPSSHTHSWTSITDKIVAGNEFNIVNAGFTGDMWFNYLPINDRSKTATVSSYHFGNGATKYASIKASGFVKSGSSSSYVLLGDGGHQTISSLSVNHASSAGNADYIRSNALPTPANNTVKAYKDSLAKFFNDIRPNIGVGANVNVGASIINNWSNDSATFYDSSTYCFIKIGGAYAGATYGQFLLSSYNLSKVGIVGRNSSQWSKIKWLAYEDQIPTDNKQLANGAGYITSAGSCAYATSSGNADKVDGYHASNLVKFYLSPMASDASADSAKSWFVNTMPSASGAIVYNVPGSGKTIIAGKSSGAFGHMLQLNYDNKYLRILRYYNGSWKSTDWEKISAGYADSAGSVAWANVTDRPSSLKNPYSLNVFGVTYDGSATKTVTTSTFVSLLSEGTSTVTDGTMFITSVVSNSGFSDTSAVNVPYKRKASCLWNYIKAKTDTLYSSKSHTHSYLPLVGGTMNANARISHDNGNLYIGRADNNGWVMTQDIASLKGTDKWSIRESGAACFGNINICSKSDGTYNSSIIECYTSNLYLNYYSPKGISLCNGGGNVKVGHADFGLKLNVAGSGYFSDTVYSNTLNHTSSTGHLIIGNKTKEISIRSSDLPDVPAVYLLQKFSTNVYYTANKGFGIRPYYLSSASMNLMETISGNKYTVVKVGDDVLAISCIIADKVPLMSQIKGTLIRFLPGDDGLIVLLKDLNNYGNGNGYLYVLPKNCNIVRSDNSNIFIADGNISSAYDDSKSRFFIYAKTYNVWIEFYCG